MEKRDILTKEAWSILARARAVIATEATFTTGTWARDAAGQPVSPTDPTAVAWDGDGAVRKVMGKYRAETRRPVMEALYKDNRPIAEVADKEGHAAVIAVFDRAIAGKEEGRRA